MSNRDVVFNLVKFFTKVELVELSKVNKLYYKFCKRTLLIHPFEALLLQNSFNRMKFFFKISKKYKKQRVNSWKRKIFNPHERFIF